MYRATICDSVSIRVPLHHFYGDLPWVGSPESSHEFLSKDILVRFDSGLSRRVHSPSPLQTHLRSPFLPSLCLDDSYICRLDLSSRCLCVDGFGSTLRHRILVYRLTPPSSCRSKTPPRGISSRNCPEPLTHQYFHSTLKWRRPDNRICWHFYNCGKRLRPLCPSPLLYPRPSHSLHPLVVLPQFQYRK